MSRLDERRKQHLASKLKAQEKTIYIIEVADALKELASRNFPRGQYPLGMDNSSVITASIDSLAAAKIVRDLGLTGKAIVKPGPNGKPYLIISERSGSGKVIRGTRYLPHNPKLINMAIGKFGVMKSVLTTTSIAFVLYVGINVLEFLLNDQRTKAQFFGTLATDITKMVIASTIGGLSGVGASLTIGFAFGPLLIAIGVTVIVAGVLGSLDQQYRLTEKLIELIEKSNKSAEKAYSNFVKELEWRIMHPSPFW